MVAAGMLAGAGVGLGLLLIAAGLLAGPLPLEQALARLEGDGPPPDDGQDLKGRLARRAGALLARAGVGLDTLACDLRVVGRTSDRHAVYKLAGALAGLAAPALLAAGLGAAGTPLPLPLSAGLAAGLAAGGFLLPDALLRGQATARRRDLRFALSSYLDLVHVLLAAGTGVETALRDAAGAGRGWAFRQLTVALDRAQLAGESPWRAFHRLGSDLDLPDLREVASGLALAGARGARLKASLAARARALRARDLAEMEAQAEAATERMSLPTVVLVVGFIVFVGFPAAHTILGF